MAHNKTIFKEKPYRCSYQTCTRWSMHSNSIMQLFSFIAHRKTRAHWVHVCGSQCNSKTILHRNIITYYMKVQQQASHTDSNTECRRRQNWIKPIFVCKRVNSLPLFNQLKSSLNQYMNVMYSAIHWFFIFYLSKLSNWIKW